MAVLPLAFYGDPALRKKGERVETITPEIKKLVEDMFDTMVAFDGIGIAAPQVHRALAIFVTQISTRQENGEWIDGPRRVFINPRILERSDDFDFREEGCLSIPGLYGTVGRPDRILIEATDLEGKTFQEEFFDLDARCFMHENDHVNGTLFIDRLDHRERREFENPLRALKKRVAEKKK